MFYFVIFRDKIFVYDILNIKVIIIEYYNTKLRYNDDNIKKRKKLRYKKIKYKL